MKRHWMILNLECVVKNKYIEIFIFVNEENILALNTNKWSQSIFDKLFVTQPKKRNIIILLYYHIIRLKKAK